MLNTLKESILDFGASNRSAGSRQVPIESGRQQMRPALALQPAQAKRILLAVLTTGSREESLRDCVQAISMLEPAAGFSLELVLLQNGRDDVAPAVARVRDEGPMPLRVVVERRKGIPVARNRALEEAIEANADYLAFIDDDAEPDRDWLVEAARVLRQEGVDAVSGPQAPVFPPDASERLRRAAIYQAIERNPDIPCRWVASNNVVVSIPFVRDEGLRFNENFKTGGSDKEFFLRFTDRGGVIRWAPDSIVREPVVPERLSIRWAIRRSWRLGTTGFQIEKSTSSKRKAVMTCLGKGGAYLAAGIAILPLGLLPRRAALVDGLSYIAHGAGFVLGLVPAFRLRDYA